MEWRGQVPPDFLQLIPQALALVVAGVIPASATTVDTMTVTAPPGPALLMPRNGAPEAPKL